MTTKRVYGVLASLNITAACSLSKKHCGEKKKIEYVYSAEKTFSIDFWRIFTLSNRFIEYARRTQWRTFSVSGEQESCNCGLALVKGPIDQAPIHARSHGRDGKVPSRMQLDRGARVLPVSKYFHLRTTLFSSLNRASSRTFIRKQKRLQTSKSSGNDVVPFPSSFGKKRCFPILWEDREFSSVRLQRTATESRKVLGCQFY